jgi:hypothetical protein
MVARAGRAVSTGFGTALKIRAALLIVVAVAMLYVTALLAVVYAYGKGYGIVGKPEPALRLAA